jgi:hypothetical protein
VIYTLAVILVLVGAAASAIMVIAMWGAGVPVLRRWRRRQRGKLKPPKLATSFMLERDLEKGRIWIERSRC